MKKNNIKGFTIIEMMIAVGIFLAVITIGVGALMNASLVQRKSQNMRSIMDNLTYTMEDMSRNIRTGYDYKCMNDISIPSSIQDCVDGIGIAFKEAETSTEWAYYINNNQIYKSDLSFLNQISLTGDTDIIIDSNKSGFSLVSGNGNKQPFVLIRLNGSILYRGESTPFSLQTSVSQRLLNI